MLLCSRERNFLVLTREKIQYFFLFLLHIEYVLVPRKLISTNWVMLLEFILVRNIL
jgi:hypothetical protein